MSFKSIFAVFSLLLCHFTYATEIKVVYANQWHPYSVGNRGDVKGILPDLIEKILSEKLNYSVRHIGVPWNRAQSMVRSGEADAFVTAVTAERLSYSKSNSKSLHKLNYQAFALEGSRVQKVLAGDPDLQGKSRSLRFCDVIGNSWADAFYRTKKIELHTVTTIIGCLKMLQRNRQDVVIHSVDVIESILAKEPSLNLIIKSPYLYEEIDFHLLVSKKSAHLYPILDQVDEVLKKRL